MYKLLPSLYFITKSGIIGVYFLLFFCNTYSQPLQKLNAYKCLDSISNTNSKASHFAGLFKYTLHEIENQLQQKDSIAIAFTRKFELAFIQYFTNECFNYENGDSVGPVWHSYFYNNYKNQLQYQLAGANAHINGDMWKALAYNFSAKEIEANVDCFISYEQSLDKVLNTYYNNAIDNYFKPRLYNIISLGFSKTIACKWMHKWRNKQEELALLFLNNQPKQFENLLARINKKRRRIDKGICLLF